MIFTINFNISTICPIVREDKRVVRVLTTVERERSIMEMADENPPIRNSHHSLQLVLRKIIRKKLKIQLNWVVLISSSRIPKSFRC